MSVHPATLTALLGTLGAAASLVPSGPPRRGILGSSLSGDALEKKRADRKRERQAKRRNRR